MKRRRWREMKRKEKTIMIVHGIVEGDQVWGIAWRWRMADGTREERSTEERNLGTPPVGRRYERRE